MYTAAAAAAAMCSSIVHLRIQSGLRAMQSLCINRLIYSPCVAGASFNRYTWNPLFGQQNSDAEIGANEISCNEQKRSGYATKLQKKLAVHEKWRTWRFFCGLFCHFSVHVQVLVRHFRVLKSFLSKTRLNCRILPPFRSQEIVQCIIHASLLSHRRVTD